VASMPWPIGIVLGRLAYFGIARGIGWVLGASSNLSGSGKTAAGVYTLFAWFALVLCWIGALASAQPCWTRKRSRCLPVDCGSVPSIKGGGPRRRPAASRVAVRPSVSARRD
jgi:restriction system protein